MSVRPLLLAALLSLAAAWPAPARPPLSLAYYGHFLIMPGLKAGTALARGKLFASPQVAVFTRPGNHTSVVLNAELGYRRQKGAGKSHSALALGLGYLGESEILGVTVGLGDGKVKSKDREWRNYIMPTLSYQYGRAVGDRVGWYGKLSYGAKKTALSGGTAMLFVELGLRWGARRQ